MVTKIDNGAPQYDPSTQIAVREWVPSTMEVEDPDAPGNPVAVDCLVAVYTIDQIPLTEAHYAAAIQAYIDQVAQGLDYRDGDALAGYATSTVPAWAAQAQAFVAWRDAVWVYAHEQLAAVQAGEREQPTVAELVGELPEMEWPT